MRDTGQQPLLGAGQRDRRDARGHAVAVEALAAAAAWVAEGVRACERFVARADRARTRTPPGSGSRLIQRTFSNGRPLPARWGVPSVTSECTSERLAAVRLAAIAAPRQVDSCHVPARGAPDEGDGAFRFRGCGWEGPAWFHVGGVLVGKLRAADPQRAAGVGPEVSGAVGKRILNGRHMQRVSAVFRRLAQGADMKHRMVDALEHRTHRATSDRGDPVEQWHWHHRRRDPARSERSRQRHVILRVIKEPGDYDGCA